MRHASWLLVVLVLASGAWGQTSDVYWLTFQLELGGHAPPQHFLLEITSPSGGEAPPALSFPWAACASIPTAQHCVQLGCPPMGIYEFVVYAQYAEGRSGPSNRARCVRQSEALCTCDGSDVLPGPQLPPLQPPPIVAAPIPLPPVRPPTLVLSSEVPALPQRGPEGLHLQPLGAFPTLSTVPAVPTTSPT